MASVTSFGSDRLHTRVRWFSLRLALLIVLLAFPRIVINARVFWISSVWFAGSDLGVRTPLGF